MCKYDISDAYKLIKTNKKQWRHFGFKWLGKFFFDSTTVFGSKAAPEKFDSLPETLVNICCHLSGLSKKWVHRQLDDVPFIAPAGSGLGEKFAYWYEKVCEDCNVPLADFCPLQEKAFKLKTEGTVLGIRFDSKALTWSLPAEKSEKIQRKIQTFSKEKSCRLRSVQSLHGSLNDFAQMCDFMRGYRYNLLALLRSFGGDKRVRRLIPGSLKRDLQIWAKCIKDSERGFPIAEPKTAPPLSCITYATDAAGAAFEWVGGVGLNKTVKGERGGAFVGYEGDMVRSYGCQKWPDHLMFDAKDSKGILMGQKSAALEAVAVLMAVTAEPKLTRHRHVVIFCDNIAVVNGWRKRYCRADPETSSLIRAMHEVEAFLECRFYVEHVKRRSTTMARLADNLTRTSTTDSATREALLGARMIRPSVTLRQWAKKPIPDWNMGNRLIAEIIDKLYK